MPPACASNASTDYRIVASPDRLAQAFRSPENAAGRPQDHDAVRAAQGPYPALLIYLTAACRSRLYMRASRLRQRRRAMARATQISGSRISHSEQTPGSHPPMHQWARDSLPLANAHRAPSCVHDVRPRILSSQHVIRHQATARPVQLPRAPLTPGTQQACSLRQLRAELKFCARRTLT
jgi:hypothetical protein